MKVENKTQWPSAFRAVRVREVHVDEKGLTCDREYDLSSESFKINLLIVKKDADEIIGNEIGAIFLGHNIVAFQLSNDETNVNTFYKVFAYACMYKVDIGTADDTLDTDVTITFVHEQKPVKFLEQMEDKFTVVKSGEGIYQINCMLFPVQIVVTGELKKNARTWLKLLAWKADRQSWKHCK